MGFLRKLFGGSQRESQSSLAVIQGDSVIIRNVWGVGDAKPFTLPLKPDVSAVFANATMQERNILPYGYLNHPNAEVRRATILEMQKLDKYHLRNQALVDRLADSSADVRATAAEAIWMDDNAVENALRCLRDEIHGSGFMSTMTPKEARAAVEVLRKAAPSSSVSKFEEWVAEIIG